MKIIVLPVGEVDKRVFSEIQSWLSETFPRSLCRVSEHILPLSEKTYNSSRQQYHSSLILSEILKYTEKMEGAANRLYRVLGVTDVDLYVPGMNFVFGEAQCPGKAAVISLYRLRPEFYGEPPDEELFHERAVKEAVHEIGHTLALRHCPSPLCVMHFSLHIGMTDHKQPRFCEGCRLRVERFLGRF